MNSKLPASSRNSANRKENTQLSRETFYSTVATSTMKTQILPKALGSPGGHFDLFGRRIRKSGDKKIAFPLYLVPGRYLMIRPPKGKTSMKSFGFLFAAFFSEFRNTDLVFQTLYPVIYAQVVWTFWRNAYACLLNNIFQRDAPC